jgi:hypothetical protein
MTINEGMVLLKTLKERLAELRNLRSSVSTEKVTTYPWDKDNQHKIESITVKYDIKLLDKKVTEIELFCFKLDSAIKQSNAKTEISIVADVDKLLAPLE